MYLARIYIFVVTLFLTICLINCLADSEVNKPFVTSVANSQQDQQLLDSRRGDIEIDNDESFQGYFYPKPSIPFELPNFITVNSQQQSFASSEE